MNDYYYYIDPEALSRPIGMEVMGNGLEMVWIPVMVPLLRCNMQLHHKWHITYYHYYKHHLTVVVSR